MGKNWGMVIRVMIGFVTARLRMAEYIDSEPAGPGLIQTSAPTGVKEVHEHHGLGEVTALHERTNVITHFIVELLIRIGACFEKFSREQSVKGRLGGTGSVRSKGRFRLWLVLLVAVNACWEDGCQENFQV